MSRTKSAKLEEGKAMRDLKLGDVRVKDDGSIGLSMYVGGSTESALWLNPKGELELMRWIAVKHGIKI